jgi:hypothetical protein
MIVGRVLRFRGLGGGGVTAEKKKKTIRYYQQ